MPNRLLKEGIVDSERINALSEGAEVFFYRLIVVADDLGRVDARTAMLRSRCFPLKESLPGTKLEKWVDELWEAGLVGRYVVAGRPYLLILNWDQRVRSNGKHPPPDDGQLSVKCQTVGSDPPTDARLGLGKGKGKGKGAPNEHEVRFDAADGSWSIPSTLREQWSGAYPALSLDAELAKASAWLLSNPANQKSNYARFLTNWLGKAQDRAPRLQAVKAVGGDPYRGAV